MGEDQAGNPIQGPPAQHAGRHPRKERAMTATKKTATKKTATKKIATKKIATTTVLASTITEADIEGRTDLARQIRDAEAAVKAKGREQRKLDKKITKLTELHNTRNPQIVVESLRPSNEGEFVNGKPAKGWVVEIECETCGARRTINTQDAFQVKFCEEHKAEARKVANKAKRENAKISELLNQSEDELKAKLAELKAKAA